MFVACQLKAGFEHFRRIFDGSKIRSLQSGRIAFQAVDRDRSTEITIQKTSAKDKNKY